MRDMLPVALAIIAIWIVTIAGVLGVFMLIADWPVLLQGGVAVMLAFAGLLTMYGLCEWYANT